MPIKTTRDKGKNLTSHIVTGHASEEKMYRVLEEFYGQETTALVLWDMLQAELAHVTPNMLQKFIRRAAELGVSRRGGQTAVVAPDDRQYGLGRMSEILSEFESTPFSFRVFRSRQDALLWLLSGSN
jgi:hypothetical protein